MEFFVKIRNLCLKTRRPCTVSFLRWGRGARSSLRAVAGGPGGPRRPKIPSLCFFTWGDDFVRELTENTQSERDPRRHGCSLAHAAPASPARSGPRLPAQRDFIKTTSGVTGLISSEHLFLCTWHLDVDSFLPPLYTKAPQRVFILDFYS